MTMVKEVERTWNESEFVDAEGLGGVVDGFLRSRMGLCGHDCTRNCEI